MIKSNVFQLPKLTLSNNHL